VERLVVTVPATTANLGPGFDSLGLALALFNVVEVWPDDAEPHVIEGEGTASLPCGPGNLVRRSMRAVGQRVGRELPRVGIRQRNDIPLARGLGSSSAAIVGGCVAANELLGAPLTGSELFAIEAEIEGHPDNVAAASFGGLTVCYQTADGPHWLEITPLAPPKAVVAIPEHVVSTEEARRALPDSVPRADAVLNVGHAAAVVAAFATGAHAALGAALEDRLHQPYRAHLVPGMDEAIAAACEAGAFGAALSGSGPTIVAFAASREEAVAAAMKAALARAGVKATTRVLEIWNDGATVQWCRISPSEGGQPEHP
jgi:homoserine kinase